MVLGEVGRVQPVGYRGEFAVQVVARNVTCETVGVGEAETEVVAELWQQAVVVELVHYEFCDLRCRAAGAIGFVIVISARWFSTITRSSLVEKYIICWLTSGSAILLLDILC